MAQGDFTRINSNIGAMNALNSLKNINTQMGVRQLRLATGKRINEAADDPAGLTIATKFKYRASGLGTALDNIGDAKNLLAVAEGGLQKINDILVQIRDKSLQAASDALGSDERTAITNQITSYLTQIDNIVSETKWNGDQLIAGSINKNFQTGADGGEITNFSLAQNFSQTGGHLNIALGATVRADVDLVINADVTAFGNGVTVGGKAELASGTYTVQTDAAANKWRVVDQFGNAVSISSAANGSGALTSDWQAAAAGAWDTGRGLTITFADATLANGEAKAVYTSAGGAVDNSNNATGYLANVNDAISKVSKAISDIGALTARLTFKEETISVAKVNTEAAHNRIMNADMAAEQLEATKLSILQQTATAMLGQANQGPQSILSLFR